MDNEQKPQDSPRKDDRAKASPQPGEREHPKQQTQADREKRGKQDATKQQAGMPRHPDQDSDTPESTRSPK